MPIAVVGMLDEREEALALIKTRIQERGHQAILMDITIGTGAIIPSLKADVTTRELLELAGESQAGEEPATSRIARGLTAKILSLHASGKLEGIVAITGMTGALISLPAMRALPFGVPKLLISGATAQPVHAEQYANYFSLRDITVMHTVVDTVGMNALVRTLAINGANAVCGMAEGRGLAHQQGKPSIAITEFGFCDKGAHYVRELLNKDYEMVSFHATGIGDKAVVDLVPQGIFAGFVDLVPGAFSEYLLGGNRGIAGPDRLKVFSNLSIPYIFCPGGFDIISCGPPERRDKEDPLWTSRKLAERKLYIHPPRVQARMSAEEEQYVATSAADALNCFERKNRVKVVIPLKGFSSLSTEGAPLCDTESDRAFATTLKKRLDPAIGFFEVDADINSPAFARVVADAMAQAFTSQQDRSQR
jgi:uncharacterized protein (UPF0261 family)